jgi:hypothetical protein
MPNCGHKPTPISEMYLKARNDLTLKFSAHIPNVAFVFVNKCVVEVNE